MVRSCKLYILSIESDDEVYISMRLSRHIASAAGRHVTDTLSQGQKKRQSSDGEAYAVLGVLSVEYRRGRADVDLAKLGLASVLSCTLDST